MGKNQGPWCFLPIMWPIIRDSLTNNFLFQGPPFYLIWCFQDTIYNTQSYTAKPVPVTRGVLMKDRETSSHQVEHGQSSSRKTMTTARHWPQTEATKTDKRDHIRCETQLQRLCMLRALDPRNPELLRFFSHFLSEDPQQEQLITKFSLC